MMACDYNQAHLGKPDHQKLIFRINNSETDAKYCKTPSTVEIIAGFSCAMSVETPSK